MPLTIPRSPPAIIRPAAASTFTIAMSSADHGEFRPLEALAPTLRDPALAALARARIAASRLDHAVTRREISRFIRTSDRRPDDLALAYGITANDAFAAGDYVEAGRSAQRWVGMLGRSDPRSELASAKQLRDLSLILASSPRQRVTTPIRGSAPTVTDAVGLIRTEIALAGTRTAAVVDTGANVSVISASLARKLGLKVMSGAASVGSATREAVPTRVAVAPTLTVAGVRLTNVAFLVLDDADLAVPVPDYRIDAVVGFPVLAALRRVAFAPGRIEVGPAATRHGHAAPLRVVGNDLHVTASVNGVQVPLHLDTGATTSSLTSLFLREHAQVSAGSGRQVRFAGAGGSTVRDAAALTDARIGLAGVTTTLPSLSIEAAASADARVEEYGLLGQDVLGSLHSYAVDFDSMTLRAD